MPPLKPDPSLCFRDPVIRFGDGHFTLTHSALVRRLTIFFFMGLACAVAAGIAALLTPWQRSYAWASFWSTAIPLLLVFGLPTLMLLALKAAHAYRLDVYPSDGRACKKHFWFGIRVSTTCSEISDCAEGFMTIQQDAEFTQGIGPSGAGEEVLDIFLKLLGAVGSFISLFVPKKETKTHHQTMYCLYAKGSHAPGETPIACFFTHHDAATIVVKIHRSELCARPTPG